MDGFGVAANPGFSGGLGSLGLAIVKKPPSVIMRGFLRSVIGSDPWVDQMNAAELKICNVTGDQGQPMYKCGGGDQGVAFIAAIRDVQLSASSGDDGIDREDSSGECWFDVTLEPMTQHPSLRWVAAFDAQNAGFQFQHGNCR